MYSLLDDGDFQIWSRVPSPMGSLKPTYSFEAKILILYSGISELGEVKRISGKLICTKS